MIIACIALSLSGFRLIYSVINSILLFLSYKRKEKLTEEHEVCQYLVNTGVHEQCSNILFQRNMEAGICPLSDCFGYHPVSKPADLISPLHIIVSSFPDIATILLSVNQIFKQIP